MIYIIFRFYLLFERTRWAVTGKTGPNDSKRVVWVLGTRFFFPHVFFYILINDLGWVKVTRTGPNNALCIVLNSFLFNIIYCIVLNNIGNVK